MSPESERAFHTRENDTDDAEKDKCRIGPGLTDSRLPGFVDVPWYNVQIQHLLIGTNFRFFFLCVCLMSMPELGPARSFEPRENETTSCAQHCARNYWPIV